MSRTITISKTEFEKLTERIKKLEAFVFGKKPIRLAPSNPAGRQGKLKISKTPDEILTSRQEAILTREYLKAKKDIASGKGFVANSATEMMEQLRS